MTDLVFVVNADLHNTMHPLLSQQRPLCTILLCTNFLFFADFAAASAELALPHECKYNEKTQPKVNFKQVKQRDYPNNVKIIFQSIFFVVIQINRTQTSQQKSHKISLVRQFCVEKNHKNLVLLTHTLHFDAAGLVCVNIWPSLSALITDSICALSQISGIIQLPPACRQTRGLPLPPLIGTRRGCRRSKEKPYHWELLNREEKSRICGLPWAARGFPLISSEKKMAEAIPPDISQLLRVG